MNEILYFQSVLNNLHRIVCRAGSIVMKFYGMKEIKTKIKYDGTPVTEADTESERIIISSLKSFNPQIPIISEEQSNLQLRMSGLYNGNEYESRTFWLVDPLDGTEAFMRKENRFTINIGLVRNSKPILGAVFFPARDILYSGISGLQAQLLFDASKTNRFNPVQINTWSCKNGDQVLALLDSGISETLKLDILRRMVKMPNTSINEYPHKLCGVATGELNISTVTRSFEWDTAAGHAILKGAGGNIVDIHGRELSYGKREFKNPTLIAHGRVSNDLSYVL